MQQHKTRNFIVFFPWHWKYFPHYQPKKLEPNPKTFNLGPIGLWILNSIIISNFSNTRSKKASPQKTQLLHSTLYSLQNTNSYVTKINNLDTMLPLKKTESFHILTKHNVLSFSIFSLLYKANSKFIYLSTFLITKSPLHVLCRNLHVNLLASTSNFNDKPNITNPTE